MLGATIARRLAEEWLGHYGVAMTDPEANESDGNWISAACGHVSGLGVPWGDLR